MKRILAPLSALALSFLVLTTAAPARGDEVVDVFEKSYPAQNLKDLRFEMSIGTIDVRASDRSDIHVSIELRCRSHHELGRCRAAAKNVRLEEDRDEDLLELELRQKGTRRGLIEVVAILEAPRKLGLDLDLGVGEVEVVGFEDDIKIDLGIGEASVIAPEAAFRSVRIDAGIGESDLVAGGRHIESAGLFSDEITWTKGPGKASVYVDCGIGEARVRLEGEKRAAR